MFGISSKLLKGIEALETMHAGDAGKLRQLASLRAEVALLGPLSFKQAARIRQTLQALAKYDEVGAIARAPASRLHAPRPRETTPVYGRRLAGEIPEAGVARRAVHLPADPPLIDRVTRYTDDTVSVTLARKANSGFELELTANKADDLNSESLEWAMSGDEFDQSGIKVFVSGDGAEGQSLSVSWRPDLDGEGGILRVGSQELHLNSTNQRVFMYRFGNQKIIFSTPPRIDVPVITTHGVAPRMPK